MNIKRSVFDSVEIVDWGSVNFDIDFKLYNSKKNSNIVKYYYSFKITFCFNFKMFIYIYFIYVIYSCNDKAEIFWIRITVKTVVLLYIFELFY